MGHEPGFELPVRRQVLRRSLAGKPPWDELGSIVIRVVPVPNPPPGHPPVAIVVEIAANLAPPWNGIDRRRHEFP